MTGFRIWRHFDYVLLVVTVLLTAYGVLMILLAAFPRDYQWLGDFWWLAYLLAVTMLVLVLFFGQSEIGEVSAWLDVGFFRFQPSFVAMNLLAISVGATLSRRRQRRGSSEPLLFGAPKTSLLAEETAERPDFVNYLTSIVMTLVLTTLTFLEPDMATAVVFVFMWLAMLFVSDVPMRYLVLTAMAGLGALYPLWKLADLLEFGYMHERMLGFLVPSSNPDVEYQLRQAFIAIGSGGLWGKGLGQGTQSQLRYLPVRHTDFIFAVMAEELGFAGVTLLFALYLVLFIRLLRIILIASDAYGRLLATGTLAMILFQLVVNVGMNLGLLPVAGLPLPFISYGNSALLTTMIGIGIAENVAMRHHKLEF